MTTLAALEQQIIQGEHTAAAVSAAAALAEGTAAGGVLTTAMLPAMDHIGERFRTREIFLPDVLLAARAFQAAMAVLEPHLVGQQVPSRGRVVLGTVEGDLHDIGKNLVAVMLRGAGFTVIDLGNSVSPARFVAAAREHQAQVIGMSALLTTTMPAMKKVIVGLREAALNEVKTVVGGAPLNETYARELGADAYGYDAARAVALVRDWLG